MKCADAAVVIDVQDVPDSDEQVIEIRSNLSMTLDRLAAVFLGLSALTLLVATWPAVMGYWPIMLIAVIHLAIVGWCLRLAWRGNWARERILIGPENVVIEHFDSRQQTRSKWPVAWLRVEVEELPLGESQVVVSCKGRHQVVGSFLSTNERLALAGLIRDTIRPYTAWKSDEQSQVNRG